MSATTLSSVLGLKSSLLAIERLRVPRGAWHRNVRDEAMAHLSAYLKDLRSRTPRLALECASGSVKPGQVPTRRDEVDDLLDALAVLNRAGATEAARSAALQKLTAYFDGMLEKLEKKAAPKKTAAAGPKLKPSPAATSSLASMNAQIASLMKRVERAETASAAARSTVAPRPPAPRPAATDPIVGTIERAQRDTLGAPQGTTRRTNPKSLSASQRAAIIAASFDK